MATTLTRVIDQIERSERMNAQTADVIREAVAGIAACFPDDDRAQEWAAGFFLVDEDES